MNNYEIRLSKRGKVWFAELWVEIMDSKMFEFEDEVTADNYSQLQIEIGNKKWIDLLNK